MSNLSTTDLNNLMEAYSLCISQEELEEEIFETIAYSLISQGYTAVDVLEYFAYVDSEDIIEDIIAIDEGTLILESVVSEEYILEQFQILNEALPAIAAGIGLGARALLGQGARRTAGVVLKRMAGPGVRKAVGGVVSKVRDVAKGALNKIPGGSGGKLAGALKTGAKWALGGAAFEGGMRAARGLMGGGDKDSSKGTPPKSGMVKTDKGQRYKSSSDGKHYKNYNDALAARNSRRGGAVGIKPSTTSPASTPSSRSGAAPSGGTGKVAPAKPAGTSGGKLTSMQQWAKANPSLASKVKIGQSGYQEISQMRDKPGPYEKQDQTPTQGPKTTPAQDKDLSQQAMADVRAQQERERKKQQQTSVTTATTTKESYDLVLDYLFTEGHVDTVDEALYVMMEMSAETIQGIVDEVLNEAMSSYERNRKRAAQRAAERNAARDRGQTGSVPGVGYVSPRRERETWTDESGKERHKSGARMPKKDK